jgi:MarR family transcriptional regulator, organic hydroperoxide resistance regulator
MTANRPLADDLGFLLSRASGVVARAVSRTLAPLGLRMRSYSILALAAENRDGVTQRQLAAIVGLDPSQVVALVDELEERGLVVRAADSNDRRTKLVKVTDEGRRLHAEAARQVAERDERHFDRLPRKQRDELREMLRQIAFPSSEADGERGVH